MAITREGSGNRNKKVGLSGVFIVLLGMLLTSWVNTQYLAFRFGYQGGLGEAVVAFRKFKIYQPFRWFVWQMDFSMKGGQVQEILNEGVWVILAGGIVTVAMTVFTWYRRSLVREEVVGVHGTARYAEFVDIEKMELVETKARKNDGVYLGIFEVDGVQHFLRYDGDAHVLVYAPTRSGKGTGMVLPTLLSYRHSTATNDIKKENYELTSGFRHRAGQLIACFDATGRIQKSINGSTKHLAGVQWNALDEIRAWSELDVMDAQNIAAAVADPDAKGMDDHWVSTSFEWLTGLFLHMVYAEKDKTLSGAAAYMADPLFTAPEQMYEHMMNAEHDPEGIMGWTDSNGDPVKTHPEVARQARAMLNKDEKERGGVLSTAKTRLSLYTEPIVARNTRRSDFYVRDLMNHDKPMSLYIVVPPSDKERLRPLTRLLITYISRRNTEGMSFEDGKSVRGFKHPLKLIIDELPTLRKMEAIEDGLGFFAGYGITAMLFVQDIIQLESDKAYGKNQAIMAGCHVRVAYTPNTVETAEVISKYCGTTTVKMENVTYSGGRLSAMLNQMSVSNENIERPLITPDEVLTMPGTDSLIFVAGHPVIKGKKIRYYNVPIFAERAKLAPPSRIGYQFEDEKGKVHSNWLMLSVDRTGKRDTLDATINVYRHYPAVEVVVYQEGDEAGEILEFTANLIDTKTRLPVGELDTHMVEFQIVVKDARFDAQDNFEVHVRLKETDGLRQLEETGFCRLKSETERGYVKALRERCYESDVEHFIDEVWPNQTYAGKVAAADRDFVLLEREVSNLTIYTIHKAKRLDAIPTVGKTVRIAYDALLGKVMS